MEMENSNDINLADFTLEIKTELAKLAKSNKTFYSISEEIQKHIRLPYYKRIFANNTKNEKLFFYTIERNVKEQIDDLFLKKIALSLAEKKNQTLKDCLKKSVTDDFDSLLEIQDLLKSILKWQINIEKFNNYLIKLDFYCGDISENLKKKCLYLSKNKKKTHFTLKNYISLFFLKTISLLINNLTFPGFSMTKLLQFLFLVLTGLGTIDVASIIALLKTYKYFLPIFLTNFFKKYIVSKINFLINAEELKIYSSITSKKINDYNLFQENIINRLESELDCFVAFKLEKQFLKSQNSKIVIIRVLENFLLNKSFELKDYHNIFESNYIDVTEEDEVIIIDKINSEHLTLKESTEPAILKKSEKTGKLGDSDRNEIFENDTIIAIEANGVISINLKQPNK